MNKKEEKDQEQDLKTEDENTTEEKENSLLEKEYEEKLAETNGQLIRLQADFMNFRKRVEKEKKDTISYALEEFICTLLPVIDNFEKAMDIEDNMEDPFYKGVEIIYKQLENVLESNNVKKIDALGKEFDPNVHHAVFMEDSEEYDSGKVIEVIQTGYMLQDKVIRPAMVKVAK